MPRGGKRQGNVGTAYQNRTDLQGSQPVAIQTSPGQTYGLRTSQEAGQKMVPVAPPPNAAKTAAVPAQTAPQPQPQQPAQPQSPTPQSAPQGPQPGTLDWTGPTNRPNEPITHGLPVGRGAGPDVLTGVGAISNRMASQDTATKLLATLALQPTAGSQIRNIARLAMTTSQ